MRYLYIFLLCLIIFCVSYWNTSQTEYFTNRGTKTIVLMGDSILKNNLYVDKGIDDILIERNNGETYSYAVDNSTINDMYTQLAAIPVDLNKENTYIFLSAGGNDIIQKYIEHSNNNLNDKQYLTTIFSAYKKLIRSIQTKMGRSKLILLDIYLPQSIKYRQYHDLINEWNSKIDEFSKDSHNNVFNVVRVSKVLTSKEDFTLGIEPSAKGGQKIAAQIEQMLTF
jgi:hypothetical protein